MQRVKKLVLVIFPILERGSISAHENMRRLHFSGIATIQRRRIYIHYLEILLILGLLSYLCLGNLEIIPAEGLIQAAERVFVLNLVVNELIVCKQIMEGITGFFAILCIGALASMTLARVAGTELQ